MLKLTSQIYARLYAKGLKGHCLNLYFWLYGKNIVGKKTTVYYTDFIKWFRRTTKKEKGSISDRQASRCFYQLQELGFAEVKCRNFGRFEIVLYDYLFVLGLESQSSTKKTEKAKSQDEEPVSDTSKKTVSERTRQQQLITTDKICRTAGIKFDKPDLPKIARYGVECVTEAIEMFKERSLTSVIKNPEGWVRRCLQCGWYKNWQKSLVPKKPIEEFIKLRDYLLENLGTLPA